MSRPCHIMSCVGLGIFNCFAMRAEFSTVINRTEAPIQRISGSLLRKQAGKMSNWASDATRMAAEVVLPMYQAHDGETGNPKEV